MGTLPFNNSDEYVAPGDEVVDKPSKDEYAIAQWLRKNVPIKKTKFLNHIVEYFTAVKAVDALLESKYAKGDDALFSTREEIVDYLQLMLEHKFFHRARKIPVSEQELKKKKPKENETADTAGKEPEKKKRKVRLDMHNDQRFVDGFDAYVWIYEAIPFYYWIIGALLVIGAIGVCLFPLWPPSVRLGVYYLSVAAVCFLVLIIVLVVLRLIIFCFVWAATAGRHHIWILPNLTEDVGVLASFWPLYKYEYKGSTNAGKNKSKKSVKEKDSDEEEQEDDKLLQLGEKGTENIKNIVLC